MKRHTILLSSFIIVLSFLAINALGANTVSVTVPAQNGLQAQQMKIDQPSEILISITTDVELDALEIPLVVSEVMGASLWSPISESEVTYIVDTSLFLVSSFFDIWQDGIWEDTVDLLLVGGSFAPGTYDLIKFSVTPTAEGTIQWAAPAFTIGQSVHELQFCTPTATCFTPTFVAADITVLPPDCNNNGIGDADEIAAGTAADCNGNGVPDECDLADGLFNDMNGNGVPDECEGWPTKGIIVYVPATSSHGPQELVVGEPGEIYFALATDVVAESIEIPIEFVDPLGGSLWDPIMEADVTFLTDSTNFLMTRFFDIWQDAIWADTIDAIFIAGVLQPGIHQLMKLSVFPTSTGTIELSSPTFTAGGQHQLQICQPISNCYAVDLFAPSITVVDPPSCCVNRGDVDNIVGLGGPVDVSDLTSLVAYLFQSGIEPVCIEQGNVDAVVGVGGPIDVSDLTFLVAYLFQGGALPPAC